MKPVFLVSAAALAALTIPTAPAEAQRWSDPTFIAAANVTVHRGSPEFPMWSRAPATSGKFRRHHGDGFDQWTRGRHDRRRHRDRDDDFLVGAWPVYTDFDANRSFDPDRWNDWWHSRPDRSFPRWVRQNQNCTPDRMWWSGSGWHC